MSQIPEKQSVKVHLQTEIFQQDETESFDIRANGELVMVGDALILRYTEAVPGQPEAPVLFKFTGNGLVTLSRRGDTPMKLFFQQAQRLRAQYQTATGPLDVETLTTLLQAQVDVPAGHGDVAVDYTLFVSGQLIGQYRIRLQFNR